MSLCLQFVLKDVYSPIKQMKNVGIDYVTSLLASGRYTVTREEASKTLSRKGSAVDKIFQRLRRSGWVLPIGDSFFTIIDPSNRSNKSLPPSWFVDAWSRHKGVEYYVGGLTAAEVYGAAHQRSQSFQMVVNRPLRPFRLPMQKVTFLYRQRLDGSMWRLFKAPTGNYRVSTPEITAYDLLSLRKACPSLDHAATVYVELGEAMRAQRLAKLAVMGLETATLQRMGWLLDHTGWSHLTGTLECKLRAHSPKWVPLQSGADRHGTKDAKWMIIENAGIQPDIEPQRTV